LKLNRGNNGLEEPFPAIRLQLIHGSARSMLQDYQEFDTVTTALGHNSDKRNLKMTV
jgi:hypothetical protein